MNKQIEEMAKVIYDEFGTMVVAEADANAIAVHLTRHGYRKQIDGEWEHVEGTMFRKASHRCTSCGHEIVAQANQPNYCPNCGAKMKKES